MKLPATVCGEVVKGQGLGAQLGFPTANLRLAESETPDPGVYRVLVALEKPYAGVCNVGTRPTVDGKTGVHVEVHIPGWSGDLYGRRLLVTFVEKLREEKRFASLSELKAQIRRDVESLRL